MTWAQILALLPLLRLLPYAPLQALLRSIECGAAPLAAAQARAIAESRERGYTSGMAAAESSRATESEMARRRLIR